MWGGPPSICRNTALLAVGGKWGRPDNPPESVFSAPCNSEPIIVANAVTPSPRAPRAKNCRRVSFLMASSTDFIGSLCFIESPALLIQCFVQIQKFVGQHRQCRQLSE